MLLEELKSESTKTDDRAEPSLRRQRTLRKFEASQRHATAHSRWLIHPERQAKRYWDVTIAFLALVSCILVPLELAFGFDDVRRTPFSG